MIERLHRICAVMAVLMAVSVLAPKWDTGAAGSESRPRTTAPGGRPDLVELIKDLSPVVVYISIEKHMLQQSSSEPPPLFRPRYGWTDDRSRDRERYQMDSLGSGFIYDAEGLIVTNAHVVEGATKILVTLTSGKVCPATVIAAHPTVDLALLKIKPPHGLRKAQLGDSSKVQVGEWVLVLGNPFGLVMSATQGIVSAKGRFLGLGPADDFLQTDASINPGNSGGPLFNMAGEVIGVNTAIIGPGKGIGFSIPANYVRELVEEPAKMKRPVRGWLGIYVEDMTTEQARALGMSEPRGTYVDEVLKAAPAYNAGLKRGDLILDAASEQIRSGRHLSRIVAASKPGDLVKMTVLRQGKAYTLDVVIGKAPE